MYRDPEGKAFVEHEIELFDRGDGVRGHFCVGYKDDQGTHYYWSKSGFSGFGTLFTTQEAAEACASAIRFGMTIEQAPPDGHVSWYEAAVSERKRRVTAIRKLKELRDWLSEKAEGPDNPRIDSRRILS